MANQLTIKKSSEQGLIDFLTFLLETRKISAVFTLRETGKEGVFDYGLITDVQMLKQAIPLHPFMPVNAGQELSRFKAMKKQVAAVIRPCELRGFIELIKRVQGTPDHFLLISYTCGGALRFASSLHGKGDTNLPGYWKAVEKGENYKEIRPTCKACEYFVPMNADATVSLVGKNHEDECVLELHTEKAKEMAAGFKGEYSEEGTKSQIVDTLLEKRKAEKTRLFQEIGSVMKDLGGVVEVFSRCVGCHGCSRVCPMCHCILCDFESHLFDHEASVIEKEFSRKEGMRLPTDTILFQLGRMNHMSFSCVGCGMCTEVCPADIPVASIFMKTGSETAQLFDYIPGRDIDEPVPVTVYKEEELSKLG